MTNNDTGRTASLGSDTLERLRQPFHPSQITWKPGSVRGNRALALAYGDLRAYMNRLDEVCGPDWSVSYTPWGTDRIICHLTINGVTRSSTGESTNEADRGEIGGTVAEAQAMKRACAMFGLGRYLYTLPSVWVEYDPQTKQFTDKAKAKLTNILVQHYRRATGSDPTTEPADDQPEPPVPPRANSSGDGAQTHARYPELYKLAKDVYGDQWQSELFRLTKIVSKGKTVDSENLPPEGVEILMNGMRKKLAGRSSGKNDNPFNERPAWRTPREAWEWAVGQKLLADLAAAQELWKQMVLSSFGGQLDNLEEGFDTFYQQVLPEPESA